MTVHDQTFPGPASIKGNVCAKNTWRDSQGRTLIKCEWVRQREGLTEISLITCCDNSIAVVAGTDDLGTGGGNSRQKKTDTEIFCQP